MRFAKQVTAFLALLTLMAVPVMAQPELPDPGMTPDHPLYFLDRAFDAFKSSDAVADERAAEMIAMAKENKTAAMAKAQKGYEKAMQKRQREAAENEAVAEEVARQSSNHLSVLAQVRANITEQAQTGLDRAMNAGLQNRERALESLRERNSERADAVANATLQELLLQVPEQAKVGLQRAIDSIGMNGSARSGDAGGVPRVGNASANIPRGDDADEVKNKGSGMPDTNRSPRN